MSRPDAWPAIQLLASVRLMKPGPLTSTPVADAGHVEVRHDLLSSLAGRHAEALAERQRHVRLEVRELRRADERIDACMACAERGGDRRAHPFREDFLGIRHDYQPIGGGKPSFVSKPARLAFGPLVDLEASSRSVEEMQALGQPGLSAAERQVGSFASWGVSRMRLAEAGSGWWIIGTGFRGTWE